MTINDYLPRNITVASGEPSVKFYKHISLLITPNLYNLLTDLIRKNDLNLTIYYWNTYDFSWNIYCLCQDFQHYKEELRISVRGKIKENNELKLIIMYAFFDNQLFPSIENIMNNDLDKLQKDINKNLTKETLKAFLDNLMTKIFITCLSFHLSYLNKTIIRLNEIDTYIEKLFIPYVSVCKSKYIRVTTDGRNFIYENCIKYINDPTISNFLDSYIEYEEMIEKGLLIKRLPIILFNELKRKLLLRFQIDTFVNQFIAADKYYNSLFDLFSSNQLHIMKIDDNTIKVLIKILHNEFNILSLLRYIIFYIETIKDYDSFIVELIINHNLTNIDAYNGFVLFDEDIKFIKKQIVKLNNFVSNTVLDELK